MFSARFPDRQNSITPTNEKMPSAKESSANWITLTSCPLKKFCKPVLFGDDEGILVVPFKNCASIQLYSIHENKWVDFVKFRNSIQMKYNACQYLNNAIYFYDGKMYQLNYIHSQLIKIKINHSQTNIPDDITKKGAMYLDSCVIQQQLHIVGGLSNIYHLSFDPATNTVREHHIRFPSDHQEHGSVANPITMLSGFGLIALESRSQILLLGGRDESSNQYTRKYSRCIYVCQLPASANYPCVWSKAEYTMPHAMSAFGCIVTDDEKHVIIFGGITRSKKLIDEIGILNLDTFRWIKSDIKCPKRGKYFAVKTKLSDDIHLFDEDGKHYKMNLSNVMSKKYEQTLLRMKSREKSGFDGEYKTELDSLSRLFGKHRDSSKSLLDPRQHEWAQCINTPYYEYTKPVVTANGAIILSPYHQRHLLIYQEDAEGREYWKKLIKYPFNVQNVSHHTIAYLEHSKTVYLFDGNFVEFDLKNKLTRSYGKILNVGNNPVSVILRNELHIVGGFDHCKHLTWNKKTKCFVQHKMEQSPQYGIIQGHGLVALEKTKQILLFGGNEGNIWNGYIANMWICNLDEHDETNEYHWKQLPCTMVRPMMFFGFVVTEDEKYVITFGGRGQRGLIDDIYVLDLASWKWIRAGKTPKKGMFHAVLVKKTGHVHLFEINSINQWKVPLGDILTEGLMESENSSKSNDEQHVNNGVSGTVLTTENSARPEIRGRAQTDLRRNGMCLMTLEEQQQQKMLVKQLQMELHETKKQLLEIQRDQMAVLEENAKLKAENMALRNNITQSLEKVISNTLTPRNMYKHGTPQSTEEREFQFPEPQNIKLLRKLQRSETFLLLSDADFETDEEFEDEEEEEEEEDGDEQEAAEESY